MCLSGVGLVGRFALHLSGDGWKGARGEEKYRDVDLVELFTHWHAGRSHVQLSQSLGIDRTNYPQKFWPRRSPTIEPGGEPLSRGVGGVDRGLVPGMSDPAAQASTWPLIAPHHDRIKGWLDDDVTVATIAQRLRDDHDVGASESSVRR